MKIKRTNLFIKLYNPYVQDILSNNEMRQPAMYGYFMPAGAEVGLPVVIPSNVVEHIDACSFTPIYHTVLYLIEPGYSL